MKIPNWSKFFTCDILILTFSSLAEAHWTYEGQTDDTEWVGHCTTGKRQSPVAISTEDTDPVVADPLYFEFYDQTPKSDSLTNNGHSVTFRVEAIREINYPQVVGGGLPGVYQFDQLHFHWGSVDMRGSEHTIDDVRYPMELHAVHFNTKYGSTLAEAMNNSDNAYDTLAVLGVMFEVKRDDNPLLDPIVNELEHVHFLNQVTQNVTLFPLNNLLPHKTSKFFRYNGSLTTPPCSEIVVWTIFEDPVPISERQLDKFRELEDLPASSSVRHHQSDNFRSTQPLNGRAVLLIDTNPYRDESEMKSMVFYISIVVSIIALIIVFTIIFLVILYFKKATELSRPTVDRHIAQNYIPVNKNPPQEDNDQP